MHKFFHPDEYEYFLIKKLLSFPAKGCHWRNIYSSAQPNKNKILSKYPGIIASFYPQEMVHSAFQFFQ
jgi:hypothetical protein